MKEGIGKRGGLIIKVGMGIDVYFVIFLKRAVHIHFISEFQYIFLTFTVETEFEISY